MSERMTVSGVNGMSYVGDHMRKSLCNHALTTQDGGRTYRMGQPDTGIFAVYLAEIGGRLCITGDIMLGANRCGIVSSLKYNFGWFSGRLSESYLCEKFLCEEWQWEVAVESMRWLIESGDGEDWWTEHALSLHGFMAKPDWTYDEPNYTEFHEKMVEIGHDGCELPGCGYPRADAGWLCAIQQRFREILIANVSVR